MLRAFGPPRRRWNTSATPSTQSLGNEVGAEVYARPKFVLWRPNCWRGVFRAVASGMPLMKGRRIVHNSLPVTCGTATR